MNDASDDTEDDDKDKKKDKKKDKDRKEIRVHTGTRDPADRDFAEWINRQWRRGEHLDKIDVVEFFAKGPMKGDGKVIGVELFAVSHNVNMEEAVELSNLFVGLAQINCDRIHKKEMTYYARAFDKGRAQADQAVDTFPLFLKPKTLYAEDGKQDEEVNAQSLSLEYLRDGMKAYQFDRVREDNNVGDLISMFLTERREDHLREQAERAQQRLWEIEQQKVIRTILMDWVQAIRDSADAAPRIEMAKAKAEIFREGFRAGKNLLTGALGSVFAGKDGGNGANNPNASDGAIVVSKMTHEKLLLDNFFNDCKSAKIFDALFGEWEKGADGVAKNTKPGIFTPDQFVVLAQVLQGLLPADALDDLMPAHVFPENAGKPLAITMEQLAKAQALDGMSESIAASLIQLVTVRTRKKNEAKAPAASTPNASDNPSVDKEANDV